MTRKSILHHIFGNAVFQIIGARMDAFTRFLGGKKNAFPKKSGPKKDAFPSLEYWRLVIWRDFIWSLGGFWAVSALCKDDYQSKPS